ncbi:MAG: hypothetical protein V1762_04110, partial [Nitrospirota bacterium]
MIKAGHNILAHSPPDKIGTPRFLPHYKNILSGISAKKSAQTPCPAFLFISNYNLLIARIFAFSFLESLLG